MLKLKMMLCDDAAGRRRLHIKAVCQSVRVKPLPPPAWIMQPPPDWQTPLNGDYFYLRERLITMQKTTGRNPHINIEDRVAHIDGNSCNYCIHTRFQRSINACVNKTEQSIYECLLGFCFNNIFMRRQILAALTVA